MITYSKIGYMGRLGNQLFQFASLLGIADKTNSTPGIPLKNQTIKQEGCYDKFSNKWISYKLDLIDGFNINIKDSSEVNNINIFKETQHHFDNKLFEISDNIDLEGYFQTEKYFKHIEKEIREQLIFKPEIKSRALEIKSTIKNKIVSLHFRRGDYLGDPQLFPVLEIDYYQKALSYFDEEDYSFAIFSDDIKWCKSIFGEDKRIYYIEGNNQFIDLCLMSLCDHNIIANSTFSWWGAWLNDNPDKKIIAPNKWFGPNLSHLNTNDIIPDNWIKI
jgi:hypothetical protein